MWSSNLKEWFKLFHMDNKQLRADIIHLATKNELLFGYFSNSWIYNF